MPQLGAVARKCRASLGEIRQDELIDSHPDILADPSGGGTQESDLVPMIELDRTQLSESV